MTSENDHGIFLRRPSAPGRMYMVLAAKRLAALIAMIRDFNPDDVVTIVAHSQGCLITLLAQAFLLDDQLRPADTLILTHPPYSLVEETSRFFGAIEGLNIVGGGTDAAMAGHYGAIGTRQTIDARLQTLANIVQAVVAKKHPTPPLAALLDHGTYHGMVGSRWVASADRDNRGKVYLYFCPEDMTVALDNMQGIGWQGVPDFMQETALSKISKKIQMQPALWGINSILCKPGHPQFTPLATLGAGFYQRVFTNKKRFDPLKKTLSAVLVGQAPHDIALRVTGEDEHAHVAPSGRSHRADSPETHWPPKPDSWTSFLQTEAGTREGIVSITGEALQVPVCADLRGKGQVDPKDFPASSTQATLPKMKQGPCEEVDPIDAAIATTSKSGLNSWREDRPDPSGRPRYPGSPQQLPPRDCQLLTEQYNKEKNLAQLDPLEHRLIFMAVRQPDGKVTAVIQESPNEARRRWQHEVSPKSFHGAIIGSSENHRNVTAYDVAIGGGQASSDPKFYAYLCAVADWRLKKDDRNLRSGILGWNRFQKLFSAYWGVEPQWRKDVIEGNVDYYSNGKLPACVPALRTGLPSTVVCETVAGIRTVAAPPVPIKKGGA